MKTQFSQFFKFVWNQNGLDNICLISFVGFPSCESYEPIYKETIRTDREKCEREILQEIASDLVENEGKQIPFNCKPVFVPVVISAFEFLHQ